MAYMAQLDNNNTVLRVLSVSNNDCPDPAPANEAQGAAFLESLGLGGNWKQTSFNATFRKNYAGIGYIYDAVRDAFIAPQPFPSWELNEDTCQWEPPVPYPSDDQTYVWNEEEQAWVVVSQDAE
jgi:hypothetical protein